MLEMLPELGGMSVADALDKAFAGEYDELTIRFVYNLLRQKPLQARMPLIDVRMDPVGVTF